MARRARNRGQQIRNCTLSWGVEPAIGLAIFWAHERIRWWGDYTRRIECFAVFVAEIQVYVILSITNMMSGQVFKLHSGRLTTSLHLKHYSILSYRKRGLFIQAIYYFVLLVFFFAGDAIFKYWIVDKYKFCIVKALIIQETETSTMRHDKERPDKWPISVL